MEKIIKYLAWRLISIPVLGLYVALILNSNFDLLRILSLQVILLFAIFIFLCPVVFKWAYGFSKIINESQNANLISEKSKIIFFLFMIMLLLLQYILEHFYF